MAAVVVFCTFPDVAQAHEILGLLVDERLCACATCHAGATSIYRWKGEIKNDVEAVAMIKTTAKRLPALTARLVALHPYDVPEVIAVPIVDGHAPYLAWVAEETTDSP